MRSFIRKRLMSVLSILLAFAVVFPFCAFAAEEVDLSQETDTSVSENAIVNNEKYKILSSLGMILNEEEIAGQESISRGLISKYALVLLGLKNAEHKSAQTPFTDIAGDEYEQYIAAAYQSGLVSGTSAETFTPDSFVTLAQAVKIFVTALGYTDLALSNGGYPTGYIMAANRIDLLDGISANNNEPLSAEDFITLYYNALHADIMVQEGIRNNEGEFYKNLSSYDGVNVLNYFYEIYETDGVMDCNEFTSVTGPSDISKGKVSVNNEVYALEFAGADNLIGYSVRGYYTKNGSEKVLIYAEADDRVNVVYVVDGDDVGTTSTTKFTFFNDTKSKTLKINNASLIYNGIQCTLTSALLHPANGTVTLIDNDADGIIDVISVMNYQTVYVESVSSDFMVNGYGGVSLDLDASSGDYAVEVVYDGEIVDPNQIKEKMIISYAIPTVMAGRYYKKYVQLSSNNITGTVEGINSADGTVLVDETEYKNISAQSFGIGDGGTFYLDFRGAIAHYDLSVSYVYGYVDKIFKNLGVDETIGARILSEKGNIVVLNFCDKLKSGTKATAFYTANSSFTGLVRYTVNTKGLIYDIQLPTAIDTLFDGTHNGYVDNDTFTKKEFTTVTSTIGYNDVGTFKGQVAITNDTKIFLLPDGFVSGVSSLDEIEVTNMGSLKNNTSYKNVVGYDVDKVGYAPVLTISDIDSPHTQSGLFLVESVADYLDDDQNYGCLVKGYLDGNECMSLYVKEDLPAFASAKALQKGDAVRFNLNSKGDIKYMESPFRVSDIGNATAPGNVAGSSSVQGGTIKQIDFARKKMLVDVDNSTTDSVFDIKSVTNVWVYNITREKIRTAAASDLKIGDYIYFRTGSTLVREMIIYEN